MMITDKDTNKIFLADCLPEKQPKFYASSSNEEKFVQLLLSSAIFFIKEIWTVW